MMDSQLFGTPTASKPREARNTKMQLSKEQLRVRVGSRLATARIENGWNQSRAAEKLGHANTTQISLWEKGVRIPPQFEMRHVALVYDVSLDYLWGLSESRERDPVAAHQFHLVNQQREMMEDLQRELTEAVIDVTRMGGPSVAISHSMVIEGEALLAAFKRFVELNRVPFEEDMKASGNLQSAMDSFEHNCIEPAKEQITRFKNIGTAAVRRALARKTPAAFAKKYGDVSANQSFFDLPGA